MQLVSEDFDKLELFDIQTLSNYFAVQKIKHREVIAYRWTNWYLHS